jgi:pantoate--beta-alanine ligase
MNARLMSSVPEVQTYAREVRARGKSLALVPTMGALHEGHQSLIRRAKQQCDAVLVSIFVNPLQFDAQEDFATYPRSFEKDVQVLRALNVEGIFAPSKEAIYPEGFDTVVEPGKLASALEGASRRGHFRGVATVAVKLFNLVQPDVAYFGQKDFQEVQVIRQLVEDLNLHVRLVICPIVREADGLAMSSRNALLDAEGRKAARVLYRSLQCGEALVHAGEVNAQTLLDAMRQVVEEEPHVKLDYLALVDPSQFLPVERVTAGTVALIAACLGSVRLMDNLILGPPGSSPDLLLQLAFSARPVLDQGARIPGLETEALCRRIESCRDCAAISSVRIPPREFLAKYLKLHYADLSRVRVVVIGRDAPMDPDHYLYKHPEQPTRFSAALYNLLGVRDFQDFKKECVLTDATRCHILTEHVPQKALAYCARHLRDELKHFPNLQTIVILGEDACQQFQRDVLGRSTSEIQPFEEILKPQGWAREDVSLPLLGERSVRVIYCYHPTMGYNRSPSLPPEILRPPETRD